MNTVFNPFTKKLDYIVDPETDGYIYLGDRNTDGSWRILPSGANLSIEKRESGVWVQKGGYAP